MTYDANYFRGYAEKKDAIQHLYLRFLKWANVLDGKGKTALDAGAATGHIVELLKKLGYDAVGLDISAYACSQATGVVQGDAEDPPFPNNSFNLITCFEVLEHLGNPFTALYRLYELLKPEGVLVATTPTPFGSKISRQNKYHPSLQPPEKWIEMFDGLPFNFETMPYILTPRIFGEYRFISHLLFDRFATHIAIKAKKL